MGSTTNRDEVNKLIKEGKGMENLEEMIRDSELWALDIAGELVPVEDSMEAHDTEDEHIYISLKSLMDILNSEDKG